MICQIRNPARSASLYEQMRATASCDYNVPAGKNKFCYRLSFIPMLFREYAVI
jgi:hypothetical protein